MGGTPKAPREWWIADTGDWNCNAYTSERKMLQSQHGVFLGTPVVHRDAYLELARENEALKQQTHLAKQDADSWRRTFLITRDGAEDLVNKLEAQIDEARQKLERECLEKITSPTEKK